MLMLCENSQKLQCEAYVIIIDKKDALDKKGDFMKIIKNTEGKIQNRDEQGCRFGLKKKDLKIGGNGVLSTTYAIILANPFAKKQIKELKKV